MRRLLAASILIAALLLPALAPAAKRSYTLNFSVLTRNDEPKKVGKFAYRHAPATCDGGTTTLTKDGFGDAERGPNGPARVRDKAFKKTYAITERGQRVGEFEVSGEFKQHNTLIKGEFRVSGDIGANTNCDTGKLAYEAEL